MKRIGRIAVLTLSVVGLSLVLGIATSRSVRAAVAALVQVSNTSANPVPTVDTERLARIPYQVIRYSNSCTGTGCQFSFPSAPQGYRLVLQHISGSFWQTPGTPQPAWFYMDAGITQVFAANSTLVQSTDGGVVQSVVNQDLLTYLDPSSGALTGIAQGSWTSGFPVNVVLSGYLENCSVTGCPAIQQ